MSAENERTVILAARVFKERIEAGTAIREAPRSEYPGHAERLNALTKVGYAQKAALAQLLDALDKLDTEP